MDSSGNQQWGDVAGHWKEGTDVHFGSDQGVGWCSREGLPEASTSDNKQVSV